ncbi:Kazal-type serine protease inhibitor family protein [Paraliomyxa miuraensis]|uniref:hypothetical protein n=1 Tax=Paraliomyxa miuraensis TaxID=376150 RepID=UPI0022531850|nr:hypothetical protein [Paraliomyxa miuraensis]MCX4240622.1 hypothetical protein [Paraliomyxa miuraensis]
MDRLALRSLLSTLALFALGCPGDDGTAEDGPEPTTTSSATEGSSTDPSATGPTATEGVTSTSSTTEPGTSDSTGAGADCGEMTCGEGEYCDWTADDCGESPGGFGNCMPLPEACDDVYQPVCGCDGQVHGNECEAQAAGVDVDAEGTCTPPDGYFECGYRFCDPGFEYCQVSVSDVGGYGDGFACVQPAEPCEPLACDCLTMEPCFEFSCDATGDGGIEIVCPGG